MSELLPVDIPTTPEEFTSLWLRFSLRWQDRNERMDRIARIARGDWTVVAPDDEELISRSPNLVQVALKDTAESSSMMPTVRVQASAADPEAKAKASIMERLGMSYLDISEFPLLSIKSFIDLYAYGIFSWVVTWDPSNPKDGPRIEYRDPRTAYPEPDYSTLGVPRRMFFARDVYLTQVPMDYRMKFQEHIMEFGLPPAIGEGSSFWNDYQISLVEYYDEDRVIVGGVYNASVVPMGGVSYLRAEPNYVTVILDQYEHPLGVCPAVIGQALDLDPEPRGQFDQVINILLTHIQLMALVLDYSDDLVYSEIWVKDAIGPVSQGGRAVIQLGPQGAIGRLPPASPSFSLFNELQQLIDNFHLGARWPKNRPGNSELDRVSGRSLETSVGVQNTVVRTGHTVMMRALEQVLRVCFKADSKLGPKRTVSGVLRNQQFLMERDKSDIDLKARVKVDYGLGFGREASESAVLAIQYHQSGFVSTETVQENIQGITDVGLERQRLLLQQFQDMALAKVLQGLQGGTVPDEALVKMSRAVQNGEDIFEVFEQFVVDPAKKMLEQQIPTGLSGMLQPGPPPQGPGGQAPVAPPPEELLAGILGGEQPETIGRLSSPLPGGGFAGSQATT